MITKLTLSLEKEIIEEAKHVAKKHGKSLSKLIEQYLKSLSAPSNEIKEEKSELLKLKGSFTEPKIRDTELLMEALHKKFMKP